MGTSASSKGPVGGVPFDPPWLDDISPPDPIDDTAHDEQIPGPGDQGNNHIVQPISPLLRPKEFAPSARFGGARRNLGEFVRSGKEVSFRKAVGHYSRTGMGGARNVASRMRSSTRTGASLFGLLQTAREKTDAAVNEWVKSLSTRNASTQEIADEIIRRVAPNGGSLDETASRESMAQAIEDLIEANPSINLFNLGDDNIWALVESFLGYEAFNRLCLDIGQIFEKSALSPRERVSRMNEMRDYLKAELRAQIEDLRKKTPNASLVALQSVLQIAVQNTFLVYEGSI